MLGWMTGQDEEAQIGLVLGEGPSANPTCHKRRLKRCRRTFGKCKTLDSGSVAMSIHVRNYPLVPRTKCHDVNDVVHMMTSIPVAKYPSSPSRAAVSECCWRPAHATISSQVWFGKDLLVRARKHEGGCGACP